MESADARNMKRLMNEGENIALLPGGFNEAALFARDKHRVFIKSRKGFIKYALQYGYSLRVCYAFGEEKTYKTINVFEKFRMWMANNSMPPVVFFSKFGVLPYDNCDIMVVCDEPLQLPKIENPSREQVDLWHGKYVAALVGLFDEYKGRYAKADSVLEVN